jgi:hypothetical protein
MKNEEGGPIFRTFTLVIHLDIGMRDNFANHGAHYHRELSKKRGASDSVETTIFSSARPF